jgi:hypothetical protein
MHSLSSLVVHPLTSSQHLSPNPNSSTWNDPVSITLPRTRGSGSNGNLAIPDDVREIQSRVMKSNSRSLSRSGSEAGALSPKVESDSSNLSESDGQSPSSLGEEKLLPGTGRSAGDAAPRTHLPVFSHIPSDDQSCVSHESGGGDSLSMVAVHYSTDPLSAISSKPSSQTAPLGGSEGGEESVTDEQSDQAVASSAHHLSRAAAVSEILSSAVK